nr:hypothetical protein [uncultured Bacteroides sp.]
MERTYINEFHKQWIESTLQSITSWQKQPIPLEEKNDNSGQRIPLVALNRIPPVALKWVPVRAVK